MTVPLTGAGGLFTRIGPLFGIVQDVDALHGGTATSNVLSAANLLTRYSTAETNYAAGTALTSALDGLFAQVTTVQGAENGFYSQLASVIQSTIVGMVALDQAQPDNTLKTALNYLITQMTASGAHLAASTVAAGAQTAVGSPNGTGVVVASVIRGDGLTLQTPFPETLKFRCTQDSQSGGATLNQEAFQVTGAAALATPPGPYNWPGGSGVSANLSSTDPTASNSGNNKIVNGSFETATTTNYPDNWVSLAGVIGTSTLQSATSLFGSKSLEYVGDSSTLTSMAQPFNTASSTSAGGGGTPATLTPQTVYQATLWYKLSSASPAAGVLAMELVDGTNTVINDSQATANTVNVSLAGVADTSWHSLSASFRLPALLPATVKLRVRLSTALTTGTNVFIDGVALTAASQLYPGGPFASVFAGATKFLVNDAWTIAITNTYGVFQKFLERFFGLRALGLQFPYSGGGTNVSDSLVA